MNGNVTSDEAAQVRAELAAIRQELAERRQMIEALIRWGTTPPSRGWLTIDGAQREALAT